jgi:hypothetical protein
MQTMGESDLMASDNVSCELNSFNPLLAAAAAFFEHIFFDSD